MQPQDSRDRIIRTLPGDNYVLASGCKSFYKVQLALNSFYIFTASSLIILVWCIIRFVQSVRSPRPPMSSFSEIDFAQMLNGCQL